MYDFTNITSKSEGLVLGKYYQISRWEIMSPQKSTKSRFMTHPMDWQQKADPAIMPAFHRQPVK